MRLTDTRIIVTGASSGIGRAVAERLAGRGARVFAAARREDRLKELAAQHERITPVRADITVAEDRATLVERAEPIDVLVNNAGVGYLGLVEDITPEDVQRMFDLNAVSTINLTLAVLPGMLERRRGHVVNVGSIAGFFAAPPNTVYSATKFALRGFSEGLRREVSGRGVHVTLIAPGTFKTEFFEKAAGEQPDFLTASMNRTALPVRLVADAVERAIQQPRVPAHQTISVPRLYGLSRLGELPGINTLIDATSRSMETLWRRGGRRER